MHIKRIDFMGIKPSYIKSTGLELIVRFSDRFTNNFDENKQVVTEMTSISSKRVRNRVAGFITRKINTGRHS
jgi:small subunit ribosomal protein S17e